jgi:alpha-glucosidase
VLAWRGASQFNPAVATRKQHTFQPIGSLIPADSSANSILLKSEHGLVELSALDRDVYRLRITQKKHFSKAPSYAVVNSDWTGGDVKPVVLKQSAKLISDLSRLVLNFENSQFRLTHDCGEAFASASIGFLGGSPQIRLRLDEDEHLFGLGETTGTFNKRGLIREFWNTDVLGHAPAIHPGMRSLYVSIPFTITMRDGVAAGLFWDNPARQHWDMGSTNFNEWNLSADSGEIDLYLMLGPTVENVVNSFGRLTGRMPMPPKWALGFHQCRYSYKSRSEVEQVAATMRRKRIPCDAIYFDIHHMDGYRVFTFGKTFPKPKELIANLARDGFKVVTIVDPGVKNDPKFGVLKRGIKAGAFVKEPAGKKDYGGAVWPGKSRYPDFLNASARSWWAKEQGGRFLERHERTGELREAGQDASASSAARN